MFWCWTAEWSSVVTSATLCNFLDTTVQSLSHRWEVSVQRSRPHGPSAAPSLSDVSKLKLESDITVHDPLCEETKTFLSSQQGRTDNGSLETLLFTERRAQCVTMTDPVNS